MEVKTVWKASELKKFLNRISTLIDETKFTFTKEGICLKFVDPAHVSMGECKIFGEMELYGYPKTKEKKLEIVVPVDKLRSKIVGIPENDNVQVIFLFGDSPKKIITKYGPIENVIEGKDGYDLADPRIPTLQLNTHFEMALDQTFFTGLGQLKEVSDHVELEATNGKIRLYSESDRSTSKYTIETPVIFKPMRVKADTKEWHDATDPYRRKTKGERTVSLYSLDYLTTILESLKGETAQFSYSTDYPIIIYAGNWKFILAPRIEN